MIVFKAILCFIGLIWFPLLEKPWQEFENKTAKIIFTLGISITGFVIAAMFYVFYFYLIKDFILGGM
jgi:hypothetical protein